MHVKATVIAIDLNPEFGEITGAEATVTVAYAHPLYSNAPAVRATINATRAEAERFAIGQVIPLVHV